MEKNKGIFPLNGWQAHFKVLKWSSGPIQNEIFEAQSPLD